MKESIIRKLEILAASAKFDVSCASSGVDRYGEGRIGNSKACGICHAWSSDGRCISLLKVLHSNRCVFDCAYCVNRRSNDIPRASFTSEELAELTIEFYRRNYIEGLFLSSAVEKNPTETMERIVRTLWLLRKKYGFAGLSMLSWCLGPILCWFTGPENWRIVSVSMWSCRVRPDWRPLRPRRSQSF